MSQVHFILGAPSTGKSQRILSEIKEKCVTQREGAPIFILTPEQMTFHTEYQLLLMASSQSMVQASALSFNRLAHRVMQEVGGPARYHLDEVGRSMLLQKIMTGMGDDLGVYARYMKKPGFIKKMDELFSEFKNYQLDTAGLREKLAGTELAPLTTQKVKMFINLYDTFTETILTQYLTTEDYFTLLHDSISQSELIKSAEIYLDGYHTFNPQEQLIIKQLARYAKKVTVALTLDLDCTTSLYETTRLTYGRLTEQFAEVGIKPSFEQCEPVENHQASAHLRKSFMQSGTPAVGGDGISFFSAGTKRAEIEEVAKQIHRLAYEEGESFHNMAIYSANPADDYRLYAAVLSKHNIPYFLDYKEAMMAHPVINLLHKVFDIFTSNWRNQAIFDVLKTGLFVDVSRFSKGASYEEAVNRHLEAIDLLENYVLARQIKKQDWLSGEAWIYSKFEGATQTDDDLDKQALINALKQEVVLPMMTLEVKLREAQTIQAYVIAVFEFLENLVIPQKKLQLLAESAGLAGDMKAQKQHEQVWAKLLALFEQIVEVAGDDEVSLTDFIQIIKVGLEQMTYATIPAALDGVQVGSVKRARYQLSTNFAKPADYGIKHAFIIGLNEGILPSTPAESSLLTERDREQLSRIDIQLAPSLVQSQQDEIFSLYTILASAKASITLSYITENEAIPSHVFTHIKGIFPDVEVGVVSVDEVYDRLTTPQALFGKALLSFKQNPNNHAYYEPIRQYYQATEPLKVEVLEKSVGYENAVSQLEAAMTKEIYGTEIEASVSRIERFNSCEFAHFMSYGLRLRERDLALLRMPDIGSLYHEALKYISNLIKKDRRSFASLTDAECKQLVDIGINAVQQRFAFSILESSERMRALKSKLAGVVYQTLLTLSRQGKRSVFTERAFELPFGRRETDVIKTKAQQLGDFKFSLRGIIDRIDVATSGDKAYLRVVDYKSGKKELELDAVYYGLSLQLLTYLDVAIKGANEISDVGGALYFHVHRPYTSHHAEILTVDHLMNELLALQASEQKMTGYLPENHDVARMSDTDLDGLRATSDIVPITLKKDGNFAARGNRVLATEDFDMLREFTNRKIEASVAKMVSGHLAINPMKHKGKSACDFCQYKAICKFEFAYHTQRVLPKMKPDVALDKMKEIVERL